MYQIKNEQLGVCYYVPKTKNFISYDKYRMNYLIWNIDLSKKIRIAKTISIRELENRLINKEIIVE